MNYTKWLFGSVIALSLSACQTSKTIAEQPISKPYQNLQVDGKLYAAFYQQRAAEYQALCLQAYSIARIRLEEAIANKGTKPLAIITDIDETFLDNSYYAVEMAKEGKIYDLKSWKDWTSKGIAPPLSGALDFFNYAASKGVTIFYITNRDEDERSGTLSNLRKYNFPIQDPGQLVLKSKESSKENRRLEVSKNYDIALLLGDSLTDFSSAFDHHKPELERGNAVKNLSTEFGKKFIVLPNVGYGDWESAVFNYKNDYKQIQKDSILYNAVQSVPN